MIKKTPIAQGIQTLSGVDIWYCESSEYLVYIGLVVTNGCQSIGRVIEDSWEKTHEEIAKSGEILQVESTPDIMSEYAVNPNPIL